MSWLPNWLTGFDEEDARRAADADARLREMNARDYAPGGRVYERAKALYGQTYADGLLDTVVANYEQQTVFGPAQQQADIEAAFIAGAKEGLAAEQAAVRGAITDTAKAAAGFIPGWLWLVALAGAALWFAWPALLRNR